MNNSKREKLSINEKITERAELIAAIISGIIILIAWRLDTVGLHTSAVVAYLTAFIIGGDRKSTRLNSSH